ncbi:MAG: amidase [Chloroflexota bacterium]
MSSSDPNRELCSLGTVELGRLYRSNKLSPVEVTRATLDRIERLNPELNAFITLTRESALAEAGAAEAQLAAGIDLGPMHGVPVSVKDIINVRGTRTTAASRILQDAPLDEKDATVVRRLRSAGAILVGKTNLHEFAFADPDPDGPFGLVQNPHKIGHQCGSSSSGSAASIAAGMGVVSLGSDTGGSIRHPASVCGIVGLKPTYGRVSTKGVIPLSVHLDHIGPLARSVADVAAALSIIAGHDPADPYCSSAPLADYVGAIGRSVRGLRLGLPTNRYYQLGQAAVRAVRAHARDLLVEQGLIPMEFELERAEEVSDISGLMLTADAWAYHERYKDRMELYGRDFMSRSKKGREASAIQYSQVRQSQLAIRQQWLAKFEQMDLMLIPGNIAGAPAHGQDTLDIDGETHPTRNNTLFNRAFSFVGFPALMIPVGETPEGMPVGVQLVGPPHSEPRLLAVGHALEQAVGYMPADSILEATASACLR